MIATTIILTIVSIVLCFFWYFSKIFFYFEKHNIPHYKLSILQFFQNVFFNKKSSVNMNQEIYEKLKPHKIGGMLMLYKRGYMICDPEIIKNVFIKDFSTFSDRGTPETFLDETLNNHIVNMKGEQWRNLRIKLTPTFTSGELKKMFPLIKTCGDNLTQVLEKFNPDFDIDIKDLCARFFTDVIATCAFGLEINSLANPDSEFRAICKTMGNSQIKAIIRYFCPNIPSFIIKLFNFYSYKKTAEKFFFSLVSDIVKYREEHKIFRHDFLDLLIGLKNNTDINKFQDQPDETEYEQFLIQIGNKNNKGNIEMTTELMVSHSFLFLTAGFEMPSSALSFVLFELALHPEIQDKMRKEVREILESNGNELTYEVMQKMKFTDMVIAEALRKHSPVSAIMRRCTNDYIIPGTKITMRRNDFLVIPVHSFHMDKDYFEKADEFYPEHFTDEAIARRPILSYIPFGEGPRMCIAARFAKMEIKAALIYLLRNFSYQISPKMKLPISYDTYLSLISVHGGVWLNCKKV